jgi:hypothetical protein
MLKDIALPMGAGDVYTSDRTNGISKLIVNAASVFDNLSEDIIDQNMCTPHCPCFVESIGVDPHDPRHEAMSRFSQVNEPYLNMRNRTWNETTQAE